jgi:hypothetical protein
MALGIWRKWRKSGIEPFGRYGQPERGAAVALLQLYRFAFRRERASSFLPTTTIQLLHIFRGPKAAEALKLGWNLAW